MRNRLSMVLILAAGLTALAGCWRSSEACRSDSDCDGPKKCLESGGVVFGNGVCVKPCTTKRLRKLCREQGGTCSGDYCVQFQPDADAFAPDADTGASDASPHDAGPTCQRPSDYEFCEARGLPCGPEHNPVEGRDKCGKQRQVDCNEVIDFATEIEHCGSCGNACDFHNADGTKNADGTCKGGSCVIFTCNDGYKNKDDDGSNGCECEVTEEVCDGRDNDCDGTVDEGDCQCSPGDTDDCYTGESGTAGTGICETGTWTCQEDGQWGTCMNQTTPASDEDCGNKLDDDCDGTVNNGCSCDYKGKSEGVCDGQVIGADGNCTQPNHYEAEETNCTDGLDNDCDGTTDEGCACDFTGSSQGVCDDATTVDGGMCGEPTDYESTESSCSDGVDNDCDGSTDGNDSDCA